MMTTNTPNVHAYNNCIAALTSSINTTPTYKAQMTKFVAHNPGPERRAEQWRCLYPNINNRKH